MNYLILLAALLPVAILGYYIYRKDSITAEPVGQLVKGFFFGVLSCPASYCLSMPFLAMGLYQMEATTVLESIRLAFFGAAIPEECAKLLMLWLLLRRNRYFDERMDGIVYAVCVSLGFAALENVMYLFGSAEGWLSVGISRAIFAVPGHFGFGILMGYYYSLVKFYPDHKLRNGILVIAAPVIAHGLYDSILFIINITPVVGGVLFVGFIVFCHKLWKYGKARIDDHLMNDYIN